MRNKYYDHSRSEAIDLISVEPRTVLDIGCGRGGVTQELKRRYPNVKSVGLDIFFDSQFDYNNIFENFFEVNIERENFPVDISKFDLILLLDVLEHLSQPEKIIKLIGESVNDECQILVSLPNFHYYSNVIQIVKSGRFAYSEAGILDRTHLRFFGYQDAVELLETQFEIIKTVAFNPFINIKARLVQYTFGSRYSAYQNIFLCKKRSCET